MKKILITTMILLFVLVLLAQIDDDLSEVSKGLMKGLNNSKESQAFLYLTGIYANEHESPLEVGQNLLAEYKLQESDNTYEYVEYPESKKLPLPNGELFCKMQYDESCLKILFISEIPIESLIEENKVLINRVSDFYKFVEYSTLTQPLMWQPIPNYQYLLAANRIEVLRAITDFKNGEVNKAVSHLQNQFSKTRQMFELQDDMIGKLVFLKELSELMDVLSIFLSESNLIVDAIPSLSQSELDFSQVAVREFGYTYSTFKELDKDPSIFGEGGNTPGWITRMVYKPNMTINAIAPFHQRLIKLAQLTPSEFLYDIKNADEINTETSKIRNYYGDQVTMFAGPDYHQYVGRLKDMEAKFVLFNHLYTAKKELGEATNPYYANELPEIMDDRMCFRSPIEDNEFYHCLRTKI